MCKRAVGSAERSARATDASDVGFVLRRQAVRPEKVMDLSLGSNVMMPLEPRVLAPLDSKLNWQFEEMEA